MPLYSPARMYILLYQKMSIYLCQKLYKQSYLLQLKLSRRVLQDYRNEGRIPYYKLGGKILYRKSDLQKLLDEGYRDVWK
ncbi:DNA-binding protein [Proteiniphilum sp. X52]|nr:DNA-binding protein [Proteiniphilum sp. X52]